jgi:hypothetical protein
MKTNRIKSTICFIIDCLIKRHYSLLYTSSQVYPLNKELPQVYLEQALIEYGGEVTEAPNQQYRLCIIRQIDVPSKLFIDVQLWLDNQESDLTLQCTLNTEHIVEGRYPFTITDVLVM